MAEITNCPNCGAPLEILNDKCGYCGTPYLDMSIFNVNGEPFILKIKNKDKTFITKVRLTSLEMCFNPYFEDVYALNQRVCSIARTPETEINLNLISIDPIYEIK